MTIKGIAFSHSALLLEDSVSVSAVRGLLQWLDKYHILFAALSTHARDITTAMSDRDLPAPDAILFRSHPLIGKNKGAPEWLLASAADLDCEINELVAVGVSKQDWLSAVNAGVVYIHAGWVQPAPASVTSLVAETPRDVAVYLSHFLLEPPRWSYRVDDPSRSYKLRALLPASAQLPATLPTSFRLQDVFTYEREVRVRDYLAQDLLMLHALTSVHLEGLIRSNAFFVVYPGSTPGSISAQLESYLRQASTFFKAYVRTDLLIRAVQAPDTSLMRYRARSTGQPDPSTITSQSNTVHVNPFYRGRLHNRTVVVFDDFTTSGMSLEWARNLLTAAGAASVVSLAIGKYGSRYRFYDLHDVGTLNPFGLNSYTDADFVTETIVLTEENGNVSRLQQLLGRWVENK